MNEQLSDPKIISNSIQFISRAMMALCSFFLVLMMLHVGADVVLKFAVNAPIAGTLETVSYYYMVSLVFLALPYVEMRGEHVSVDLFFQKFPPKLQITVYAAGSILAALYYGVFAYTTFHDALIATAQRETVMANFLFYVWPSRWALPLGSGLLVLMLLLNAVRAILTSQLIQPDDTNSAESVV